uniref:Uncharacterized protein n=1 Tax=Rhizophora mucronata TaxID=61149 RepID=A0A2P2QM79_RHIMU
MSHKASRRDAKAFYREWVFWALLLRVIRELGCRGLLNAVGLFQVLRVHLQVKKRKSWFVVVGNEIVKPIPWLMKWSKTGFLHQMWRVKMTVMCAHPTYKDSKIVR